MRGLDDQIKELEREGASRQQEGSAVKDKIQTVNRQSVSSIPVRRQC
jgi:hypothetical protein